MSIVNVIENEDGTVSIPIPDHMLEALMVSEFRLKVQGFSIVLSPIKEISDETLQEKFDEIISQVDEGMAFRIKSGDIGRKDVMLVPYNEEEIALLEKIESLRENS